MKNLYSRKTCMKVSFLCKECWSDCGFKILEISKEMVEGKEVGLIVERGWGLSVGSDLAREDLFCCWRVLNSAVITLTEGLLGWSGRGGKVFLRWNFKAIMWVVFCSVQFVSRGEEVFFNLFRRKGWCRGLEDFGKQVEEHQCCSCKHSFKVASGGCLPKEGVLNRFSL